MGWLLGPLVAALCVQMSPAPAQTPLAPVTPNPKFCIANADIDKNIDKRLPIWMQREIKAVMLGLLPCTRYNVSGVDSQGRFITNRYSDYLDYSKEFGGHWQRIDSASVRDPAGTTVQMASDPLPEWLTGVFTCTSPPYRYSSAMRLRLLPDGTGWQRDAQAPRADRIEVFAYETADVGGTLTLAYSHSYAYRFQVQHDAAGSIRIIGNVRYQEGDGWVALPNDFEWTCVRGGK